jgi:hypothetical protein
LAKRSTGGAICRPWAGFALAFGVALGCGSDNKIGGEGAVDAGGADADPDYIAPIVCSSVAGNRLSREYIEPVPGVQQEFRIMDREYDVECRYRAESDGSYTCYPVDTTAVVRYLDANCTSALASFPVGAEPTKFTRVTRLGPDACAGNIQEFRVVGSPSPVVAGQGIFRLNSAGECRPFVAQLRDYYVAGPVLETSDFVTATTEPFTTATRVSTLVHTGDDGSSMCARNLSPVDSILEENCQIRLGEDELPHCVPIGGTAGTFFLDPLCEAVGDAVPVGECVSTPPKYVVDDVDLTCGATARSVSVLTSEEVPDRYRIAGPNCQQETNGTETYYLVGASVSVSEFATFAPEDELGDGRLVRKLMTAGDRFGEFSGQWHDTKLEVTCVFGDAGDGSFRCLPETMVEADYFSDSACTMPITLAPDNECQSSLGYLAEASAMGTRIFATQAHTETVYDLSNGFCDPVTDTLYEASFELEPSSFQPGEKVLQ